MRQKQPLERSGCFPFHVHFHPPRLTARMRSGISFRLDAAFTYDIGGGVCVHFNPLKNVLLIAKLCLDSEKGNWRKTLQAAINSNFRQPFVHQHVQMNSTLSLYVLPLSLSCCVLMFHDLQSFVLPTPGRFFKCHSSHFTAHKCVHILGVPMGFPGHCVMLM